MVIFSGSRLWLIGILGILEIFAFVYMSGGLELFWLYAWAVPLLVVGMLFFILLGDNELVNSMGKSGTLIGLGLLFIPLLEFILLYLVVVNVLLIVIFTFTMLR